MLLEFRVTNFKSFKTETTLSLVASNRIKSHPQNVSAAGEGARAKVDSLNSIVIYGANASGKSNLVEALRFMGKFIDSSLTERKPGQRTGIRPFAFGPEASSSFEVAFVHDGLRYTYGFTLDRKVVLEERLLLHDKGKTSLVFSRIKRPNGKYEWSYKSMFLRRDASLERKTREDVPFLSVAAQFNNEFLSKVYEWFDVYLRVISMAANRPDLGPETTAQAILDHPEIAETICDWLRSADLGIQAVAVNQSERELERVSFPSEVPPTVRSYVLSELAKQQLLDIKFSHITETPQGFASNLDFSEESAGTQRFFNIAWPLLETLTRGYTLVIDELDASMHPRIVRLVVELFQNPSTNPKGAQLIFTTHDTTLLDQDIYRRDQIWFVEKSGDSSSQLYPLTDFTPKKHEALGKGYLAGRYGAIPYISGGMKILAG